MSWIIAMICFGLFGLWLVWLLIMLAWRFTTRLLHGPPSSTKRMNYEYQKTSRRRRHRSTSDGGDIGWFSGGDDGGHCGGSHCGSSCGGGSCGGD